MNSAVLDASAILAVLNREPGVQNLAAEILMDAVVSAVNAAEVQTKLVDAGLTPDTAWSASLSMVSEVLPFTPEQAKTAGSLMAQTRAFGLSLGDRACLALALELNAPVYTSDRAWKNLKVGVKIHVIR